MPDTPYKPIQCADYDIYEIAIMQARLLKIEWKNQHGKFKRQTVKPLVLHIMDGAEYLTIELANSDRCDIRLDMIQQAQFEDVKN